MPPSKTKTKLQAAAAEKDAETKAKKGRTLLASALALLGLSDAKPSAKMSKKTETTKHTVVEESDSEAESEEEEEESGMTGSEEEEEEAMSTGSTGSEGDSTGSTHPSEEEEEEEEESASEEEEEKALARAVSKAYQSTALRDAFLAALPKKHRDTGALFAPHRLSAQIRKATGTKTTYAAAHALADWKKKAKGASAAILTNQAKLETRVAAVEGARRKDRVRAIVDVAKERGTAGATTKEGREMLRAYGMQNGTKALTAFLATQPQVARTSELRAKANGDGDPIGLPSVAEQEQAIVDQLCAGITDPKERAETVKLYHEKKKANGAATPQGRV